MLSRMLRRIAAWCNATALTLDGIQPLGTAAYVGTDALVDWVVVQCRVYKYGFWVPAVGNGQLGQFLALGLDAGFIKIPGWKVESKDGLLKQVVQEP